MKKILIMLLVLSMLFTLEACTQPTSSGATPSDVSAKGEMPEQSDDAVQQSETEKPSQQDVEPPKQLNTGITIEETVLVDEKDVKITATELRCSASSVELRLIIENNSTQNLTFLRGPSNYSCTSINGYMIDSGYLYTDVSAGKKTNETLRFDTDELTLLGITEIADITLGIEVVDEELDTYLHMEPKRIATSVAEQYDYSENTYRQAITSAAVGNALGMTVEFDAQEELFNQNGIRVCSETMATNSDGEQALLLEIANESANTVFIGSRDITVNGLNAINATWSTDCVNSGTHRIIALPIESVLGSEIQNALGIEKAGTVSFSLEVRDENFDTWFTSPVLTVTVPGVDTSFDTTGDTVYEGSGIRVISKGLVPDALSFSDDIHLLLLIENTGAQPIVVDGTYDSLSINGYMNDFICYSKTVSPNGSAVLDITLWEYDLEENGIYGMEDIQEAEFTLEIRDTNYHKVAEPVITVNLGSN